MGELYLSKAFLKNYEIKIKQIRQTETYLHSHGSTNRQRTEPHSRNSGSVLVSRSRVKLEGQEAQPCIWKACDLRHTYPFQLVSVSVKCQPSDVLHRVKPSDETM